jgi:hypothetical protein
VHTPDGMISDAFEDLTQIVLGIELVGNRPV